MSSFTLGKTAKLETITIRVKNRDEMIAFYREIIGFTLKQEENALAIMGIRESVLEHLWLEESPRAHSHFGEIKKLASYTIQVASLAELASIYCRVLKNKISVIDLIFTNEMIQLTLLDPEENQLVVYVAQPKGQAIQTPKALLEQGDETTTLAPTTQLVGVHLNAPNKKEAMTFFQDVLGIGSEVPLLTVTDTDGKQFLTAEDEVLGLDFLKFGIEEADLLALEQHLTLKAQDFYIDKKKSILTVFDPMGVEWWFMREKGK